MENCGGGSEERGLPSETREGIHIIERDGGVIAKRLGTDMRDTQVVPNLLAITPPSRSIICMPSRVSLGRPLSSLPPPQFSITNTDHSSSSQTAPGMLCRTTSSTISAPSTSRNKPTLSGLLPSLHGPDKHYTPHTPTSITYHFYEIHSDTTNESSFHHYDTG
jgi:hypothetical protein